MLEEKLPVDVGDLAAEGVVEVIGQWQVDPAPAREELRCRFDTGLHLRVGELRPGDSDLDVFELQLFQREPRA